MPFAASLAKASSFSLFIIYLSLSWWINDRQLHRFCYSLHSGYAVFPTDSPSVVDLDDVYGLFIFNRENFNQQLEVAIAFNDEVRLQDEFTIASEKTVARRRALFWAYLAEWIVLNEESLTTIKYDDIVLFPDRVLQTILGNNHNQIEMLKPSVIRTGVNRTIIG